MVFHGPHEPDYDPNQELLMLIYSCASAEFLEFGHIGVFPMEKTHTTHETNWHHYQNDPVNATRDGILAGEFQGLFKWAPINCLGYLVTTGVECRKNTLIHQVFRSPTCWEVVTFAERPRDARCVMNDLYTACLVDQVCSKPVGTCVPQDSWPLL